MILGTNQTFASPEAALAHHGVKGMKWGVRKKYYRSEFDKDSTLKRGSTVQNISAKTEVTLDGRPVYGAYTDRDRLNYKANYGSYLKEWSSRTVYQNDLKVTKDIKIPSEAKAVKLFQETYAKDPEGMARSIAKAKADTSLFANLGHGVKMDAESRAYRQLTHKGDEWMSTKGYAMFSKTLASSSEVKARTDYFNTLKKNGYGGLRDTHDINNSYRSEDPVILFDNRSYKRGTAQKLSQREIDAALKQYKLQN